MSSHLTIKSVPYTTTSGSGNPQLSAIQQTKTSNNNHTNMINQLAGMNRIKFKKIKNINRKNNKIGGTSTTNQVVAPTLNVSYKQTLPNDDPQSIQGISNSINNLKVTNNTQSMYDNNAFTNKQNGGYTTMIDWGCYSGGKKTKIKKRKTKHITKKTINKGIKKTKKRKLNDRRKTSYKK